MGMGGDIGAGTVGVTRAEAEQHRFLLRVYRWMSLGLTVTAFVAMSVAASPAVVGALVRNPLLFYGLLIVELLMVLSFASVAERVGAAAAGALFTAYAAMNGITFGMLFLVYTRSSIASTFLVTAGMFAGMSVYGATTRTSLAGWGSFLMMGLWGVILASVVNLFLRSPIVVWLTSWAGVIVFTGLTAYDTQRILSFGRAAAEGSEEEAKGAIHGALVLYLDFINLFLSLLRLMGDRRE